MNKDFQQLRKVFEGGDPFMTGGHQVVGLRKRKRVIPEWTRSNKAVRAVLIQAFPKLANDLKQRARASCWARIIHLFFRLQWTSRQISEEMQMKIGDVRRKIVSITRVAAGLRANTGKNRQGMRGRPRLKS